MSYRLRIALATLVLLILANLAWRVWAGWGLITINADHAPMAEVIRSIERQGGIRLVSNAGPDAKITMHVHRVPLVRALQILGIDLGASCTVGYLAAPTKLAIEAALSAFSSGGETTGWKKFLLPMPPMGGGSSDGRQDRWNVTAAADGKLQTYLEQGAQVVDAQFWVPEDWNPAIASAPSSGGPAKVVQSLARAGQGTSEEVFLLAMQPQPMAPTAGGTPGGAPSGSDGAIARGGGPGRMPGGVGGPPGGGPPGGGPPSAEMRAAMEKRELARIDTLTGAKKGDALAEFEKRKKFFDELAQLTPEERQQKMRDRMDADMRSGNMQFETRMTQFDAMHTAEQRANFFRMVIQHNNAGSSK